MKAAVWYGQKDVRVEERKSKELQDNEVKVKVSWAGICGTDLHEYLEGPIFISTDKPDPFLGQKAPVTLGHEFSGVVDDIGSKVAEFTNAPEDNVYKLPDNVSDKEGALVEPTAVAVQAIKEGEVLFGDTVAIFGAGPIGLLTVVAAKAAGASKIFVFDLSEERLNK